VIHRCYSYRSKFAFYANGVNTLCKVFVKYSIDVGFAMIYPSHSVAWHMAISVAISANIQLNLVGSEF
jgi:hypothetical protein